MKQVCYSDQVSEGVTHLFMYFVIKIRNLATNGTLNIGIVATEEEAVAWASAVPSRLEHVRTYDAFEIGKVTE